MRWPPIDCVLDQYFPTVAGLLESIQIEGYKIIKEVAFHLTTKDVDLASKYVQCMSISTGRSWTSW